MVDVANAMRSRPQYGTMPPPGSAISAPLAVAIGISILLHAALLSIHFKLPDAMKWKSAPQTLDMVLVNSKSKTRPVAPEVLAQANLDGGGNVDENRRAKTPLPALKQNERGDELQQAKRRVQDLEARQRQLLTQNKAKESVTAAERAAPAPSPEPAEPATSGVDLRNSALAMARLEAQIARQTEEYSKRPRKAFVGTRAAEHRFAQYVEDWRLKVERVGNLNYPEGARGRIYGNMRLTVSIKADGSVDSIQVDRPSGHAILDRAAEKIIQLAAPFAPFPPEIRKDTDIIVITRTWTFAPGDKLYGD